MRHYLTCLGCALPLIGLLWLFAGWTATAATQATAAGAELSLPVRIWFATGNFVSAYFAFLSAALLCGAVALASYLRSRSEGAS